MIPVALASPGARAERARQVSSQVAGAQQSPIPFERRPGLASGARALQVRSASPTGADLQIAYTGENL